jgi:uncharacterized membrane protein
MDVSMRVSAAIAYVPVIGWLFVLLAQRHNAFAMFHVRQAIGLVIFLIAVPLGWAVITWLLSWIPFGFLIGNALFALVAVAIVFSLIAWVVGIINALRGRAAFLPIFGRLAFQKLFPVQASNKQTSADPKALKEL